MNFMTNLFGILITKSILVNSVTICDVLKSMDSFSTESFISPMSTEFAFLNSFTNLSESRALEYIVNACPGALPEIVNDYSHRRILILDCLNQWNCVNSLRRVLVDAIVDGQVSRRCSVFVLIDSERIENKLIYKLLTSKWSKKVHGAIVKWSLPDGRLLSSKYVRPLMNPCSVQRSSLTYSPKFLIEEFQHKILGISNKCSFVGRTLTAAITKSAFCDFDIDANQTMILKPSVDLNALKLLSELFAFEINGIDAKGDYGDRDPNGTWTGLIGMAVNGQAQIALCDLIYSYDRIQVLDFECPLTVEPVTFLTKAPGFQDRKWQFGEVFPTFLWLSIGTLFLILWAFLYMFDHSSNFSYGFLLVSVALCQSFTALAQSHLREFKPRLLIGLWALIAFILAQLYIGVFHSRITIPARDQVLDSVSGVRRAAETDTAFVFTTRFLRNMAFRAECCDSFDWSLGQHLRRNSMPAAIAALESKIDSLNSYQWHPERPLVFITSSRILHLYSAYTTMPIHISQASFMYDVVGLAIEKDALFGGHFALAVRRLLESGFFVHWNRQMISKHQARGQIIQKQNSVPNSHKTSDSKLRSFRLEELQSVFILYIMCNLLAILVFLIQTIVSRYQQPNM